ncbi:DUF4139 domain-containing protein [Roseibium album]|uniref:DUF4139 domain-containing protein n=1 Tax=Roseibium album TaxID=311410 RepID=A0A0M7AVL0_9HYPH|nr:DUF4139 domain-containing protein [Roseibium album]CTQ61792.1 hypothetical protein LA5094_04573 [Roseibium album]CTQ75322.1 hypothetical protein LA5096_04315 [Roseibium album]CTQ78542.1 hypothetical protein LA5095_04388 [Roseibium album]
MIMRLPAIAFLCVTFSALAEAEENGPITSITLSSGGLAEIVRKAEIDSTGEILMTVPLEQVNDILKSIVVYDATGVVEGLSLPGPNPLAETFKNLPFAAEDLQSPARLLSKLQGTRVQLEKQGTLVEGLVMGVSVQNKGNDGQVSVASILSDGSILGVDLEPDTVIRFLDDDIQQKVSRALSAVGSGKSDGARTVSIKVAGEGAREVSVSYVVPTPIWKTAYRVVMLPEDKARLQAWAVLENASGEDWDDVRVKLSSGAPVTLKQRLHDLYWRQRPEVPVDVAGGYVPRADSGAMMKLGAGALDGGSGIRRRIDGAEARQTFAFAAPAAAPPMEEAMAQAQVGQAEEGAVTAFFALPDAIDLESGETLSAPIVDAVVSAESVSVFQPESGLDHPIAAILIKNETDSSLPKGILTVYDRKEGYVGDAQINGMPAGELRMASFATDRKVRVATETEPTQEITSVKVSGGILTATVKERSKTVYTVRGAPDGDRQVIIEHPRREGWRFSSPEYLDSTKTHRRLKLTVPMGETVAATVEAERTLEERHALFNTDQIGLLNLVRRVPDTESADKLRALADMQAERTQVQSQIQYSRKGKSEEINNQQRHRANLSALSPGSDLYKRSLQKLDNSETRIEELDKETLRLEARLAELRKQLGTAINNF